MYLFQQMTKWNKKQGRATSEKHCSESRTQEHVFTESLVWPMTEVVPAKLPPFQPSSTTMLLSFSQSQVLLWVCSADSTHELICKWGNFDGQEEDTFLLTFHKHPWNGSFHIHLTALAAVIILSTLITSLQQNNVSWPLLNVTYSKLGPYKWTQHIQIKGAASCVSMITLQIRLIIDR